VAVFVPPERVDDAMDALSKAGGGRIGAYSRCSFRVTGSGTFLPAESATPFVGRAGREERVEEIRLESVVPRNLLSQVLRAVRAAHPYEEPAIDVYPLAGGALGGGIGAVGDRESGAPLDAFWRNPPEDPSGLDQGRGAVRKTVRRIAIVAGSGSEFAERRGGGADLFVTGDMKYHQALEAAGERCPSPMSARFGGEMDPAGVPPGACGKFGDVAIRVFMEQEPQWAFRRGQRGRKRLDGTD
jgi:hypothetical protein